MFAKNVLRLTLTLALAVAAAQAAEAPSLTVGLKNAESWTVLVGLGKRNGVRADADFEVVGPDGSAAALLYPAELQEDHFWSQPLTPEAFERVRAGMPVRQARLDRPAHDRLRREGDARRAEVSAERAEARREEVRAELGELRERRRSLLRQQDALEERVASREKDLIGTEAKSGRTMLSQESDIDRSFESLATLSDERDELQARRETLAEQDPFPKDEMTRLSNEINRLNDRMESERHRIRVSRDRRRAAQGAYISAREEWKRLLVDIEELDRQIQDLTDRIRELEAEL